LTQAHAADLGKIRAAGNLRIGYSTEIPGFLTKSGSGASGFAVALMDVLAKDMKVNKVSWIQAATPQQLLDGLKAGTYDAILDPNLPQPLTDVDLTRPLACTGGVIMARPGGPTTENDLENKRIAAVTGSPYFYYIRNLSFKKNVNVFRDDTQALLGFLSGTIDALVTNRFDALKIYKKVGTKQFQVSPLLWSQDMDLVVMRSTNKEFIAAVSVPLKKMQVSTGEYTKLSNSFFNQDVQCVV